MQAQNLLQLAKQGNHGEIATILIISVLEGLRFQTNTKAQLLQDFYLRKESN